MTTVQLLVGTKKGAFIFESDDARVDWSMRGPYCDSWPVLDMTHDPTSGVIYVASGNEWFGPAIWRSEDDGETWTLSSSGISYGEGEDPITEMWSIEPSGDVLEARRLVSQHGRRRKLGTCQRPSRPPLSRQMGGRRGRPHLALDRPRSEQSRSHLGGDVCCGRDANRRRRRDVGASERGHRGQALAGSSA